MANCDHNCSSCGQDCGERVEDNNPTSDTNIKKIVAVLSGKGGVGKSMVSSMLAVELARKGFKVGILDADITGPSIAKMFNVTKEVYGDEEGIFPIETNLGIKIISINMMLETPETPVMWRGPILGSVIKQFYTEVHWGELDYLVIDMPPGTSDVALSVMQIMPVDEIVMVTSPSKLVSMVVAKAINMADATKTHVLGLVENMAYVECPNCKEKIFIYNEDDTENVANKYNLPILAKLPMKPELASKSDEGTFIDYNEDYLKEVVDALI